VVAGADPSTSSGQALAGVAFEDRGERELKGVGEPVRVFAVRSDG
jgi:class 3 adenylate cyclase